MAIIPAIRGEATDVPHNVWNPDPLDVVMYIDIFAPSAATSGTPLPDETPVTLELEVIALLAIELDNCHEGSGNTELTPP